LHSLLFSRDEEIISLVGEILKNGVSQCGVAPDAVRKLASAKFVAIIMDNADAPGCGGCFVGGEESCDKSIGIVLAVSLSILD